ncbi:hypothetical protein CRX72_04775 [Pantoea sp. BRM17]|nr:hypothetical protein CRX72_04775 [Pantoea sp. BRM17]
MSFAAGTFSAGASFNPQHLRLSHTSGGVPNSPLPLIIWPRVVPVSCPILSAASTIWIKLPECASAISWPESDRHHKPATPERKIWLKLLRD